MVQSVLVSEERLFRYQCQTYRAVQGHLQEYSINNIPYIMVDSVINVKEVRPTVCGC